MCKRLTISKRYGHIMIDGATYTLQDLKEKKDRTLLEENALITASVMFNQKDPYTGCDRRNSQYELLFDKDGRACFI